MLERTEKLKSFETHKLIDIVKNYKQYGYDDDLRNIALDILSQRGIDREQLKITGNLENQTYHLAKDIYKSFGKYSKTAFTCYALIILLKVLSNFVSNESATLIFVLLLFTITTITVYFIFLIKSFIEQNRFYKTIGKEYGTEGILIYFFLGMPFYIVMYFYFRRQMNEEMKLIN